MNAILKVVGTMIPKYDSWKSCSNHIWLYVKKSMNIQNIFIRLKYFQV